ncbi:DUF932 domain-containing protein [Nonomuraea aridisoli]|uniref:DUF932 domain-containing protein n=1 Tax=Nonomuraea aridisoli TaxID=2070368 RepID=A0A2W2EBS6_9ACTN|nr:DUF932 domain-containing protein [Nonomuraea aridisoli]PZG19921.1 DUF932 domain-containing protein [Nonomuraea aridisoli]
MTSTAPVALTTRNARLEDLVDLLRRQQAHKVDVVVHSDQIRAAGTRLQLVGTPPLLSDNGVTTTAGLYLPTQVCDQGLAGKLGIPQAYLRRLRSEKPDLYDANVNGWMETANRPFLMRGLHTGGGEGIARAFLSDSYRIIDDLDVLMAALDGVRLAGVRVQIDGCDLTERRMYVRVVCEQVRALAPDLLRDYRSPFTGAAGADNPVVFAGFLLSNSETGCGAFTIIPRLVVQVCRNGMTITADAPRHVHLGARMEEGIVRWSDETAKKNLELITAQTRDAVTTFLDVDYVRAKLHELSGLARTQIADPSRTIELVTKKLSFGEEQQEQILAHFIKGADLTAGGVMHAITSVAQTVPNADLAHEMESQALRAMQLAARL